MKKGSITVESALVLPLFLFFVMQLFSMFEVLSVYCRMELVLEQVAEEVATYLYITEAGNMDYDLLSEGYILEEVLRKAEEKRLDQSVIDNGLSGIAFHRIEVLNDGDEVDLMLTYRVVPWFSIRGIGEMKLENHCRIHAWTGYDRSKDSFREEKEQTVYVTKTGTAYHLYPDCSYLKAGVRVVERAKVGELRNCERCKYYPCEFCCMEDDDLQTPTVIITPYGTRYHDDPKCKALFKDVTAVSIKDVGDRHLCPKCEQRKNGEQQ